MRLLLAAWCCLVLQTPHVSAEIHTLSTGGSAAGSVAVGGVTDKKIEPNLC